MLIGEEDFTQRGYGAKILRLFIDHFLSEPDIKKIIIDIDPKNPRAIRCYEKVGFKFVKQMMTPEGLANLVDCIFL